MIVAQLVSPSVALLAELVSQLNLANNVVDRVYYIDEINLIY